MGTVVHAVSVVRLNNTALPSCNWLPGFPPPWYWLPLKTVTADSGSVGKTGSRMPALPNGSGLPGKCHALPRAMVNPFLDARIAAPPYASAAVTARVIRGVLARAGETEIRHIFAQVRKNLVALRDER